MAFGHDFIAGACEIAVVGDHAKDRNPVAMEPWNVQLERAQAVEYNGRTMGTRGWQCGTAQWRWRMQADGYA